VEGVASGATAEVLADSVGHLPGSTAEVLADSVGHLPGSPDYVDEALVAQLDLLPLDEREQKRLLANQYKLEGNTLYSEGKTQGWSFYCLFLSRRCYYLVGIFRYRYRYLSCSVTDPDPCGSVLKWFPWIRIRNGNTDADPGQSKWCPKRRGKSVISC